MQPLRPTRGGRPKRARVYWLPVIGILCLLVAACTWREDAVAIESPFVTPTTMAVAPVLNFSGEFQLDPVKAADLLASELSYVDDVDVLPVSRVVAVLAQQGKGLVESPAHALEIAQAVGADAILVAGITEYDAYTPVVGLVIQIYSPERQAVAGFNPTTVSRLSRPFAISRMADPLLPTSQVQAVYDAHHRQVREAVRRFAGPRTSEDNHLGWRQYLKVQTLYLRFCWNAALKDVMNQERSRRILLADGRAREESG